MRKDISAKREREKEVVSEMIALYCRKQHGRNGLCPECEALVAYAGQRSDKCPFMETKTFCSNLLSSTLGAPDLSDIRQIK